ncbi:staygreen family protein [Lederbergia galactosidilytica]|uniref:Staygreen protein domain-containing protein n=1 Tax=Lederbergia galactosidilytica TaxID=217031 RepID=A0A0Q9XN38_9BACI|nr:staygreen family protein [Lederbergia galactosidilytica]KRG09691.1 hypothetical protein ACA29_20845 [Lederbergia galactosidilytica]KRG12057.1 hypothetical protein ACA30_20685 [Virgibacillus soli]MBP1913522.1 hypothetical protein [Lederbergia galactosidilytica]OAK72160.1 hypothetical protein ABB05_08960 [Lederbergia galactosidilytica]
MEKLQVNQLTVIIVPPATNFAPVDGRQYIIDPLFGTNRVLTIGLSSNRCCEDKIEKPFILEWMPKLGEYVLTGKLNYFETTLREKNSKPVQQWRNKITQVLALIIKSDYYLFQHVPWLLDAPILLELYNRQSQLIKIENFGTPRKYMLEEKAE